MESRARTILPIIAVILVVLIAITAFFITRRIRNTANVAKTATPSGQAQSSNGLLVPTNAPTSSTGPRPTVGPISRVPATGPEDDVQETYTTAFDDAGFRETTIKVKPHTTIIWINLGTKPLAISRDSVASEPIQPNASLQYIVSQNGTFTVVSGTASQQITVQ